MEPELIMDRTPANNDDLVLIVDDDPTLRMIARATLEKAGFRTAISRAIWAAYERSVSLGSGEKTGDLE